MNMHFRHLWTTKVFGVVSVSRLQHNPSNGPATDAGSTYESTRGKTKNIARLQNLLCERWKHLDNMYSRKLGFEQTQQRILLARP